MELDVLQRAKTFFARKQAEKATFNYYVHV